MTYTIAVCTVKKKTPVEEQKNCPKYVKFYSKNKFEKLVHLVGFIIRPFSSLNSPICYLILGCQMHQCFRTLVSKLGSTDSKGSAIISQGVR